MSIKEKESQKNKKRDLLKHNCSKLTKLKFLESPQLRHNPLTIELLERYTSKKNENKLSIEKMMIDLYDFIHGNCLEKKLKFLFDFYDTNHDGYITKPDLFKILVAVSDYKMDEKTINEIINSTMLGGRVEKIDFEKFKDMLEFKGTLKKCMVDG